MSVAARPLHSSSSSAPPMATAIATATAQPHGHSTLQARRPWANNSATRATHPEALLAVAAQHCWERRGKHDEGHARAQAGADMLQ